MHTIALITYDISPYRGSEAAVSWNFVSKMHPHVKLVVIYGGSQDEVERYINENPIENVEWICVPKRVLPTTQKGLREDFYYSLYYRQWHKQVAKLVGELVDAGKVDLIHYLNPIGFKEPGWCWKYKSVPYVWGPVMCVENRPISLFRVYSLKQKVFALARRVVHNALFVLNPRVKKAFKNTDAIFAVTPKGQRMLKRVHGMDSILMPENGIIEMYRDKPIALKNGETLKIIWVGRVFDQSKGLLMLLDALSRTVRKNWQLHLVGEGGFPSNAVDVANKIKGQIVMHGKIAREDVLQLFRESHLHVISSMGEATTTVLFEAMSYAVPTMTLDHCGMAGVVCEKCGIKIPIKSYNQVVNQMASSIDSLIEHPERIEELSNGVIDCSKKFMWDNRISIFVDTYTRLIDQYKG